jgi:hypothetical protein
MDTNLLIVIIIICLLFGTGSRFGGWGGPVYSHYLGFGGWGLGTILIIVLIVMLLR